MKRILLIYPPWTRNASPPLGLGMIQGDISAWGKSAGVTSRILDLNALSAFHLPNHVSDDGTHRTHRSILHRRNTLRCLSDSTGYQNRDVYRKMMLFYRDLLSSYAARHSVFLTPGDFVDQRFEGFGRDSAVMMAQTEDNPVLNPVIQLFEETLIQFKPDLIGISVIFRSQLSAALALSCWIRRRQPGMQILLGGGFMNCLPDDSVERLRSMGLTIIQGAGEPVFRKMAGVPTDDCLNIQSADFTGIDFSYYFSPLRTVPMITSRGCYWRKCTFCDECREPFHMDHPDHLMNRIQATITHCSPGHIHFTDHAIPPAMLRTLSTLNGAVSWSGFARATRELTDQEFIKALAASGCRMLQLGIETPVRHLLQSMKKGTDPDHFPAILHNLHAYGITSYVYMLFGYPEQLVDDWEAALSFLENNPPDYLNISIFRLPPDAPLFRDNGIRMGKTEYDRSDSRLYVDLDTENSVLPQLRRWISSRLRVSPTIKRIIKNTPHYYKSSHAAYFNLFE